MDVRIAIAASIEKTSHSFRMGDILPPGQNRRRAAAAGGAGKGGGAVMALQLDAAAFAKLWKALISAGRRSTMAPAYETAHSVSSTEDLDRRHAAAAVDFAP
jgi:hypothetical protein